MSLKLKIFQMNSFKLLYPLLLTVFLAGGVYIGTKITPGFDNNSGAKSYNKIRDIIEVLDKNYVDTLNADELFESTINELLHKLDPHSSYIPKEDLNAATERVQGVFGGIGVRFFLLRDTISVTNVVANSPSMKAGLLAGDQIIKIENKTIAGKKMSTDEIMKKLKGPQKSVVNLTILRNGKMMDKKIIRDLIPYYSISATYLLDNAVGYIRIDEFSKTTAEEFETSLLKLKALGMKKLVIDVRNNGGGVLQSAVKIVDEFLPKGKLILTTKGKNFPKEEIFATNYGNLENMPVVVIINENSASASEILAGALQDHDRATVIGRRSFGKGLVQQDIPLNDGSNLRLVVARYYTPTGRSIQRPYSDNYEDYMKEYYDRYESGELYKVDSTKFADSLKFYTKKGKVVYGGGGIFPDVFVPFDSTLNSWYITELYYKSVFQSFAFDYVKDKRTKWQSMYEFKRTFQVTDQLVQQFNAFIDKNYSIVRDPKQNMKRLKEILKAEIARQLWEENAYYYMNYEQDKEVLKALEILK